MLTEEGFLIIDHIGLLNPERKIDKNKIDKLNKCIYETYTREHYNQRSQDL